MNKNNQDSDNFFRNSAKQFAEAINKLDRCPHCQNILSDVYLPVKNTTKYQEVIKGIKNEGGLKTRSIMCETQPLDARRPPHFFSPLLCDAKSVILFGLIMNRSLLISRN